MHEPSRPRRRLLPAAAVLAAAIGLAACSSSPSSAGSASGGSGSGAPAAASGPGGSPGSSASTPSAGGSTAAGTATFPAVAGATDLAKEPAISAGTPPPPTSLQTRDLVVGTGATATATSTVTIHYVGADYADGKVFDASWTDPGGPTATFPLTGTVPGFAQGITGMKVGGRREIVIPPSLGYGSSGQGPVSANETLVFVVDLLQVKA